jgi:hypothetical protein
MSYSRYFKIAIAMAAYQHTSARQNTTFSADRAALSAAGLSPICGASESGMIAATTSTAADTNHFSCSLSAPDDPANRTTTAAALTSRAAGTTMRTAVCDPGYHPSLSAVNGSAQTWQARTTSAAVYSMNAAATNHAAGRDRRELSRPVGNSRSVRPTPQPESSSRPSSHRAGTGWSAFRGWALVSVALLGAVPAVAVMDGISHAASGGLAAGTRGERAGAVMALRRLLQRLLAAVGSLVALSTLALGAAFALQQNLPAGFAPGRAAQLAPQTVLIFGGAGSALVAAAYAPASTALKTWAQPVR